MCFKHLSIILGTISILLTLSGCIRVQPELKLTGTTNIDETGLVIHHPPIQLTEIDDSLIGAKITPLAYAIYNRYTGKMVKKISVDTSDLPNLISFAGRCLGTQKLLPEDMHSGSGLYEIQNGTVNSGRLYLFVYVSALSIDTVIKNNDTTIYYYHKKLPFVLSFDKKMTQHKYSFIESTNGLEFVSLCGTICHKGKCYAFNNPMSSAKNKVNIVYAAVSADSIWATRPTAIQCDSLAIASGLKMQITSFSVNKAGDLIISNQHAFYNLKGEQLARYTNNNFEKILSFKCINDGYLVYTYNEDGKSHLKKYNTLKTVTVKEFDNLGCVLFTSSGHIVRFAKKGNNYQLETYKI